MYTLTKEKIQKLRELQEKVQDSRSRIIIDKAIEGWSKPGIKIANCRFGIIIDDNDTFVPVPDAGCCLIAACIVGTSGYSFILGLRKIVYVRSDEFEGIQSVFDNPESACLSPLEEDVAAIRDIVLKD